jgi:hypothetical protein
MAVVLFPVWNEVPALEPAALRALARLGVTSVSLVGDDETAGLVFEGWAFDPARAHQAAGAVTGTPDGVRTLRPLAHLALSSGAGDDGRRR